MSIDLTTHYLGMTLRNPIVASSSPLTGKVASLRELEESGVAAVVLPSLFEEQVEHDSIEISRLAEFGAESFAEAITGYFPELDDYNTGPDEYLAHLEEAKAALTVPVIASLNGTTRGGWLRYAKRLEAAGADAIELNVYLIPTDPYATAEQVEQRYIDLITATREAVELPIAVKIGPYFSSLAHTAHQFADAGADALVLFNRFYQPDIDLEELTVVPNLQLSTNDELRLPLRWVALLHKVRADLAVTSGVHDASDVIKSLLVGAKVAMMASALLRNGPHHIHRVLATVETWLLDHDYESVAQMQGSMSLAGAPNPDGFVRSNYMKMLASYSTAD